MNGALRNDPPVGRPDREHVAAGERAAEQADALGSDLTHIYTKLRLTSRVQLVEEAARHT